MKAKSRGKNAKKKSHSSSGSSSSVEVHDGIACDGCELGQIKGPRFKSEKSNVSLCESCYARRDSVLPGKHKFYVMTAAATQREAREKAAEEKRMKADSLAAEVRRAEEEARDEAAAIKRRQEEAAARRRAKEESEEARIDAEMREAERTERAEEAAKQGTEMLAFLGKGFQKSWHKEEARKKAEADAEKARAKTERERRRRAAAEAKAEFEAMAQTRTDPKSSRTNDNAKRDCEPTAAKQDVRKTGRTEAWREAPATAKKSDGAQSKTARVLELADATREKPHKELGEGEKASLREAPARGSSVERQGPAKRKAERAKDKTKRRRGSASGQRARAESAEAITERAAAFGGEASAGEASVKQRDCEERASLMVPEGATPVFTSGQPLQYFSPKYSTWLPCKVVDVNVKSGAVQISLKPGYWFKGKDIGEKLREPGGRSTDYGPGRCAQCSKRVLKEAGGVGGILCRRTRNEGAPVGCGRGFCWTCVRGLPPVRLGKAQADRAAFDALEAIGITPWWMHEACMAGSDASDYAAQMAVA